MTHNVAKADALAAGVSEVLYGWAKAGPAQSNVVAEHGIAVKIVNSFMPDIGNDHIGLSHRNYILLPSPESTDFGAANIAGKGSAMLMHVTWFGSDPQGITAVIWLSEKQPIEIFRARGIWQMAYPEGNPYQGNPWSFFLNTAEAKVDAAKLKVTLTRNGQTEVLDGSVETKERLFTIGSFPLKTLIAWRPYNTYSAGDKVRVTIEGIEDARGLAIPVSYDVNFFKTGTLPHPNLEGISVNRQTEKEATLQFTSDRAGKLYYPVREADAYYEKSRAPCGGKRCCKRRERHAVRLGTNGDARADGGIFVSHGRCGGQQRNNGYVSPQEYYADAVARAAENGIVSGMGDGLFARKRLAAMRRS